MAKFVQKDKARSGNESLRPCQSVSVNDLAIDVFGCFRYLFSDAEILEDVAEDFVGGDVAGD